MRDLNTRLLEVKKFPEPSGEYAEVLLRYQQLQIS